MIYMYLPIVSESFQAAKSKVSLSSSCGVPLDDVIRIEFRECMRFRSNDPVLETYGHLPPLLYKRCVRHDET